MIVGWSFAVLPRRGMAQVLLFAALWVGALSGCSLFPSGPASCEKSGCPTGQVCNTTTSMCQAIDMGSAADLSMSMMPDLLPRPDLYVPDLFMPDLLPPPDLRPQCVTETDCGASSGLACVNEKCVTCSQHSDCASQICDPYQMNANSGNGVCVPPAKVIYVYNNNGAACTPGAGTMAAPVCTIAQAVALLSANQTVIRVMPSTAFYPPVSLNQSVSIYGPAGQGGMTAMIGNVNTMAAVNVTGGTVLVDGFAISTGSVGVSCIGAGATLSLHRDVVSLFSSNAIAITGCAFNMDRCNVNTNGSTTFTTEALLLTNVNYTITNNFILANNSVDEAAVHILGTSSGNFRFNTVAANISAARESAGLDCAGATNNIQDSIFSGNTASNVSHQQLNGTCTVSNVEVGLNDPTPGGLNTSNPTFINPATLDYRLDVSQAGNNTCCIDQAKSTTPHDYFGTTRPLGLGYDIGAHEAK